MYTGKYFKDFSIFLRHNHPLAGVFFAHPDHPFSKVERSILLITSLCLSQIGVWLGFPCEDVCLDTCSSAFNHICDDYGKNICPCFFFFFYFLPFITPSYLLGDSSEFTDYFFGGGCDWATDCGDCGIRRGPVSCTENSTYFAIFWGVVCPVLNEWLILK